MPGERKARSNFLFLFLFLTFSRICNFSYRNARLNFPRWRRTLESSWKSKKKKQLLLSQTAGICERDINDPWNPVFQTRDPNRSKTRRSTIFLRTYLRTLFFSFETNESMKLCESIIPINRNSNTSTSSSSQNETRTDYSCKGTLKISIVFLLFSSSFRYRVRRNEKDK